MRTANNRDTWVTNPATENDTELYLKPNGEKYQLKFSRTLSTNFLEEKMTANLLKNSHMGVNFYNPITREYTITRHRDGEQGLQRIIARLYCQDTRINPKKAWKTFNKDHTTNAMKANSKDNSLHCYTAENSWPELGMIPSKLSNFSNVPANLTSLTVRNMRRMYFCYNDPGHHDQWVAKKNGHPFSNQGLVGLAKGLGLPCCDKHPTGCGRSLRENNIVKVDTSHCLLLHNCIWAVPVKVWHGSGFGCVVGFVKVLFDQLDLVGNRVAIVKRINFDDFMYQTQAANHAVWIGKKCHGVVEAYFLDGVHAGCSEDVLESEFAGGDFSNDLDDPNDSDSYDEDGDEDGDEASA
jgi:hypothetical protein